MSSRASRKQNANSPPELSIYLLGGFRVALGARVIEDAQWRLRKAKSLIKILALAPDHTLHREEIMEHLWADLTPRAAANNFHQALYAARQILHTTANKSAQYLKLQDQFLSLSAGLPLWIDVDAFEAAALQARRLRDSRNPHRQIAEAYHTALALYRGELLPKDRYEDWASVRREALRQEYLRLLGELSKLYETQGEYRLAAQVLNQLLDHDPANEAAHQDLMRVYARAGNRQQALKQYAILRQALKLELDAEPDSSSQALYEQILVGHFHPLESKAGLFPTNLPFQTTSFIGRARELSELSRLLATTRLLTFTGSGGCGKTRLALQVGDNLLEAFRDGVWFVELAAISDATLVPRAIASALNVQEASGQPITETLTKYLGSKQLLLILDACEHLIEASAHLADALLRACPNLKILAASREPLRIPGELTWHVPSLALPDLPIPSIEQFVRYESVQLFCERAVVVNPNFVLTPDNASAVAQICLRLDGLPLAIELAAARVNVLTVQQILARLDDRFGLLTSGSRAVLTRQQTLRATMDWSFDLLAEKERVLFQRLGIFSGGCSIQAVEAICIGNGIERAEVLDVLSRLIDKSLLLAEERRGEARYRMLETIREYARQRLSETGEMRWVGGRHRDWCIALVEQANANFWWAEHGVWVERLEREYDNLRAALTWCLERDTRAGLRLATALAQFWALRGFVAEGMRWLDRLLIDSPEPTAMRAGGLLTKFVMAARSGAYRLDEGVSEESLAIYRALDERLGHAHAYQVVGGMTFLRASCEKAKPFFESGLALARENGFHATAACATHLLGVQAYAAGAFEKAKSLLQESIAGFQAVGNEPNVVPLFLNMNQMPFAYGVRRRWRIVDEESILLIRQIGAETAVEYALGNLGNLARAEGDTARAQELLERALARFSQRGDQAGRSQMLGQLGNLFAGVHDYPRAKETLDESLAIRREIGDRRGIGRTLNNLGNAATLAGDYERARTWLAESWELFQETKDKPGMAQTFNHLGNLALERGDYRLATSFYEKSFNLFGEFVKRGAGPLLLNLAACARLGGNQSLARARVESAILAFKEYGDQRGIATASEYLWELEAE